MTAIAQQVGALTLLYLRALRGLRTPEWPRGELARQAHAAGNQSVLLITTCMAFVGMVLVFLAGYEARRILGDTSLLGPAFIQLLVREFGPVIAALMVAARVGAGIAAELGSMTVTEQIDALRMNAADPVRYLVSPRLAAVWLMTGVLCIYGSAVAFAAGSVSANAFFDVPYEVFMDFNLVDSGDVLTGLLKSAAFGICIPITAAWAGLTARGGSRAVGQATTRAVVVGSIGVILLDALIGGATFVVGL